MSAAQHRSLLDYTINNRSIQIRLIDILCYILVILGTIGNILGLFLFSLSRRTWQVSSSYACLATSSCITNLLCVIRYASILHSTTRYFLREIVGQTWWGCKLYEVSFSFRVISSWITLFWMFERLICVSRKLRSAYRRCCIFKLNFIIPITLIFLIVICVIAPPVYIYQPGIPSHNDTTKSMENKTHCDVPLNASDQWKTYFHEVYLGKNHFTIRCLFSELIPTGAVILFNSYIIYRLLRTHRHLHRKLGQTSRKEQLRTTSWMNAVLILHSLLFLSSLLAHITGHFVVVEAHEAWWAILAVLMNCSLNFYIYSLSGKAFRNELRQLIQQVRTRFFNRSQARRQQSDQTSRCMYELRNYHGAIQWRVNR